MTYQLCHACGRETSTGWCFVCDKPRTKGTSEEQERRIARGVQERETTFDKIKAELERRGVL